MPDPLTPWLRALLPDWFPVEAASAITAAAVGVLLGRLIKVSDDWRVARRKRIAADETLRKLEAKKVNEHIKLLGSFFNTVGAAILGVTFIAPYLGSDKFPSSDKFWWIGVGIAFPIAGHIAIRFTKSES